MSQPIKSAGIEISAALLGCLGTVVAAIIGGIFLLLSKGQLCPLCWVLPRKYPLQLFRCQPHYQYLQP